MSNQSTAKALPGKTYRISVRTRTCIDTVPSMELNYTRDSIAITIILRISKRLTTTGT